MAERYGPMLGEMTWVELRDAVSAGYGVLLPIGAMEQHGPHLPLATDHLLPLAVAKGVAARTQTLVATPIAYGCRSRPLSGGGQSFPGTTSVRGSTLLAQVRDLVAEFVRSGFEKITVINWHLENRSFVYEGVDQGLVDSASRTARAIVMESVLQSLDRAAIDPMFPEDFPGWDVEHAAILETSLMLALHPELVRTDRIADDAAVRHPKYEVIPAPADFIPASGVLYRATLGTKEKGVRLYEMAVDSVVGAIEKEFGAPS
jgi:creatinine amidohydrolase